jgi:hypothetical protein
LSETSDVPGTDVTSDSSPAPETPVTAPTTDPQPSAASSPASSDGTSPPSGDASRSDREGLLAAVRAVVAPKTGDDTKDADEVGDTPAPKPDETQSQTKDTPGQAPPATGEADPTEQELKRLKPETRRRIETLLTQRNEARQQYTAVEPELAQHRQLQGYLREHQLAADDVNMLLGVGAALRRGDYQSFLDGVTPYVQAAQEALGFRLPQDLQKQVNDGEVSESAARELTRARHTAAMAEANARESKQQLQSQSAEQRVLAVRQVIDTWEAGVKARDPDYPAKAAAVRRIGQALLQERGVPQTPEEAQQLVQAAYVEATQMLLKARPAPQATRRTPSGIQGATQPTHAPRTMKEAALQALEAMRSAS